MLKLFKSSKRIGKAILIKYLFLAYALLSLTVIYFSVASFNSYLERKELKMKAAAYEIESSFTNTLDYTESVLSHINRKIAASGGDKAQVNKIFKSFNESHVDYASIKDLLSTGKFFWIDSKGLLTASSEYGAIKVPLNVSDRDYLAKCEQTPWKIFVGTAITGASSGQYVVPAAVGVSDHRGHYIGTTAVGFKVYDLIENFKKLTRDYKVDFLVLDSQNTLLMESVSGLFFEDRELARKLQHSVLEDREETLLDFNLFSPNKNYVIERNFEKYPYKVLISSRNSAISGGASSEIWPHLIELLIVTIFFSTILYFVRILVKD